MRSRGSGSPGRPFSRSAVRPRTDKRLGYTVTAGSSLLRRCESINFVHLRYHSKHATSSNYSRLGCTQPNAQRVCQTHLEWWYHRSGALLDSFVARRRRRRGRLSLQPQSRLLSTAGRAGTYQHRSARRVGQTSDCGAAPCGHWQGLSSVTSGAIPGWPSGSGIATCARTGRRER